MNRYKTKRIGNKKFTVEFELYGEKKQTICWSLSPEDAIENVRSRIVKLLHINGATNFNVVEMTV